MKTKTHNGLISMTAALAATMSAPAYALPLAPENTASIEAAASVLHSKSRPFAIYDKTGDLVVQGILHDRATRDKRTGNVLFEHAFSDIEYGPAHGSATIVGVTLSGFDSRDGTLDPETARQGTTMNAKSEGDATVTLRYGTADTLPVRIDVPTAGIARNAAMTILAETDYGATKVSTTLPGLASPAAGCQIAGRLSGRYEASATPVIVQQPQSTLNGDFLITASNRGDNVGDGRDEMTVWAFGFKRQPDYDDLLANRSQVSLRSAQMSFRFIQQSTGAGNDRIYVAGMASDSSIRPAAIGAVAPGVEQKITIDLLDHFEPDQIKGVVLGPSGARGALPMWYSDDSIVTGAAVDLVFEMCPE